MIAMHRLLQPSGAVKRWVVLTGMKAVGKYDVLHGLVANPQPNPQCTESNEKLDALYQQAIPLAVRLIEAYAETLDTDEPLDKAYDHTSGNSEGRPAGGQRNSLPFRQLGKESAPHGGARGTRMQKKKFKVTPLERAWILYDVGNSAFVLMIATLVPIFFNALAEAGGVSKVN